jgi:hypothetical protein
MVSDGVAAIAKTSSSSKRTKATCSSMCTTRGRIAAMSYFRGCMRLASGASGGGPYWIRTSDQRIKSPLLYLLS